MAVEILAVQSKAELERFIRVPMRLSANDPNYVAPLMFERREALSKTINPFFQHADVQFWLAHPANNFGWILITDAESVPQSVTHFGSREDPTNAPALILDFTRSGASQSLKIDRVGLRTNQLTLAFTAEAQWTYALQSIGSLSQTNWQTLAQFPAATGPTNVVFTELVSDRQRFYRLQGLAPP